jgi:hypothetical protein
MSPTSKPEMPDEFLALQSSAVKQTVAHAYRLKASAMGYSAGTLEYLEKANALMPCDSSIAEAFASYYDTNNNDDTATYNRYVALADKYQVANNKSYEAWVLATSSNDADRDGERALELAKAACDATDYQSFVCLDRLAFNKPSRTFLQAARRSRELT